MKNLIAVRDEKLNTEAGRVVYWSIHGETNVAALCAAIGDAIPADDLPAQRTPQAAFSAAVRGLATRHRLIRPVDKRGGGFAIVDESPSSDEFKPLHHHTTCTVKLVGNEFEGIRVSSTPEDHPLRAQVQAEYERQLDMLNPGEVGAWLVRLAERTLKGVRLRPSGGFYFIPKATVETWQRVASAVGNLGPETFQIPALASSDVILAVTSAIGREAQEILDGVAADLDAGTLGARALTNREDDLKTMEGKLRLYEELLGVSLTGLRDKLDEVQANLTAAALSRITGLADDPTDNVR